MTQFSIKILTFIKQNKPYFLATRAAIAALMSKPNARLKANCCCSRTHGLKSMMRPCSWHNVRGSAGLLSERWLQCSHTRVSEMVSGSPLVVTEAPPRRRCCRFACYVIRRLLVFAPGARTGFVLEPSQKGFNETLELRP